MTRDRTSTWVTSVERKLWVAQKEETCMIDVGELDNWLSRNTLRFYTLSDGVIQVLCRKIIQSWHGIFRDIAQSCWDFISADELPSIKKMFAQIHAETHHWEMRKLVSRYRLILLPHGKWQFMTKWQWEYRKGEILHSWKWAYLNVLVSHESK